MTDSDKLVKELRCDRDDRERQHRELIEALRASSDTTAVDPIEDMRAGYAASERHAREAREDGAARREQNRARGNGGGDDE